MELFGTLTDPVALALECGGLDCHPSLTQGRREEETSLDQARALDRFLAEVERRAFSLARIALRNDDDALDIVQDAMLQLARHYAARPSDEWKPLFYRILHNKIRDFRRRAAVRAKFTWIPRWRKDDPEETLEPEQLMVDEAPLPPQQLMTGEAMQVLEKALQALPARQQEAFMLRTFEGLDVSETAVAMGCSEGSVKTHFSRAVHALRARLGDVW